jgi:signal transduction histidine kinase
MAQPMKSTPEEYSPLPGRLYQGYVLFWSAITLGGLGFAFFMILANGWGSLTWRYIAVLAMLLIQIDLYLGLLLLSKREFPQAWLFPIYFISSLVLWTVETWLFPQLFWLGFTYLGQMFGMLPLIQALVGTLYIFLVDLLLSAGVTIEGLGLPELFGLIAGWVSILVLLVYMNHLGRTSRERARLIDELRQTQQALEASQEKEAELAVLRERERLARDMHDTLGHNLAALAIQLEAVQRLYKVDPQAASAMIDDLKTLTRSSMDELRRTLAGLRSPGLDSRPLTQALQELCVDFSQRSGVEVNISMDEKANQLPLPLAEALWRVTQEALTNVEKHANARRVALELQVEKGEVNLIVTDDGSGFDPSAPIVLGHFGLQGMRERIEGLGGELSISSRSGDGSLLEIHIPTLEKEP